MKGYRKLAPGEVIREGDVMPAETYPSDVGKTAGANTAYFRKARTEGCPPGWRWADAGERANHAIPNPATLPAYGIPYDVGGTSKEFVATMDCDGSGLHERLVMPYPEDPRLEEE